MEMQMHQQPSSCTSSNGGDGGVMSNTKINWLLSHFGLDLPELYDMPITNNDLAELVATSNPSINGHEKESTSTASTDVFLTPALEACHPWGLNVADLTCSTDLATYGRKRSSWNISFMRPQSLHVEELAVAGCPRRRKRALAEALPHEQMQMIEKLLASMEDGHLCTESIMCSSKRKLSFGDNHEEDYQVEQLAGCNGDAFLHPGIEPLQHIHLHNFIKSADSTETATNPSTFTKGELHIQAERRRREKLNQRFIALSAILPGLKKMDKASILADAIKYVKQLEQQLKLVDESKVTFKTTTPVSAKSSNMNNAYKLDESCMPDIEARMFGKSVLIRVHCDKIKNVLIKCVEELDKMHVSIVNANVLSFSNTSMDLTFTAQIEEDSGLTPRDIVEALHAVFNQLL